MAMAKRVRIYTGENDRWHGKSLFRALVETLHAQGGAGSTVLHGVAGFGTHSHIHTTTVERLAEDLPVVVEWVDSAEQVERVLPLIQSMLTEALVTVEDVEVLPRPGKSQAPEETK